VKIIALLGAVILIVLTPARAAASFAAYALVLLLILLLARIPLSFVVKRVLWAMPFILLVAASIPFIKEGRVAGSLDFAGWKLRITNEGLLLFFAVLVKSSLSVVCLAVLSSTTRFDSMLRGLELLSFPRLFLMVLSFMYRYIFLIYDDLLRMRRAKRSRGFGCGGFFNFKVMAGMLGLLFIRGYERAERVYLAMCSRGFDGTFPARDGLALRVTDVLFLALAAAGFGLSRVLGNLR